MNSEHHYFRFYGFQRPDLTVTWRPPQQFLHYQDLYWGIYEYLRAPPVHEKRCKAVSYLSDLNNGYRSYQLTLQYHRILWTREWLKTFDDSDSDADTVENADYS